MSGNANVSEVFSGILTNINDFIKTIFDNADRISAAIGGLVSAVVNAFPKDISGNGLSFGAWLGESVVKAVELAASALSAVIPVIVDVAELLVSVATSEITASVFEGLVNVAEYLSEHEGVLKALVGVIAGVFVGGKLIKGFIAVKKLFGVLGGLKLGAVAAKAGGGLLVGIGGMTGIIGALAAMFTAITAALKPILIGIGAVALIAAAIAGLTWIFDKIGALDQLRIFGGEIKEFALNLIDVVGAGLKVAAEALSEILAGVGKAIGYLLNPDGSGLSANMDAWISGTQDIILALIGLGESFIDFIEEFTTGVIDNFEVILKSLADYGVDAGKGAFALAGGIAAIIGATSVASWATAFGDGVESIFRKLTGSESTVDRLYRMGEAISAIDSAVVNMPTVWQDVAEGAYSSGFGIMNGFSNGMLDGLGATETLLMIRLTVMMNNLQSKLDQMPLTLTFKEPNLNRLGGYGGSVYNSTTNYDVRVNNGSALSQLYRDAR